MQQTDLFLLFTAPPEYVVLRKLEYYKEGRSEKHVLDIRAMLEASAEIIDQDFLTERVGKMGLEDVWGEVLKGCA